MAFSLLLRDARKEGPFGGRPIEDDEVRRRLVEIHARIEALRVMINNMLSRVLRDGGAGTEPSMIKVYYSELLQDFTELGVRMGGIDAQYLQSVLMGGGYETGYWMHDHLYSWSWTIAGGSNEVQRNIIAERALGLPREPKLAPAK
jgi:alkylation response protein AidB-like acyl-CoA dehydrogenase